MNNDFCLVTAEREHQPWEMWIEVDTDSFRNDNVLIDEVSTKIRQELAEWDGVMWHYAGYNMWWWFDESEMNRFVSFFTIMHSGRI